MEPIIRVNGVILRWPSVYQPSSALPDIPPRYNAAFMATEELVALFEEHEIRPKYKERLDDYFFHARTGVAPLITPRGGDFDAMVRATQIAAARNIPLDRLLRDLPTDIKVTFYNYTSPHGSGRGMSLVEVIADEAAMLRIATEVES